MAAQGLAHEGNTLNLLGGIELATLNATYLDDGLLDTLVAVSAAESNISPAEMRSGSPRAADHRGITAAQWPPHGRAN